jgi:hypothetical protein
MMFCIVRHSFFFSGFSVHRTFLNDRLSEKETKSSLVRQVSYPMISLFFKEIYKKRYPSSCSLSAIDKCLGCYQMDLNDNKLNIHYSSHYCSSFCCEPIVITRKLGFSKSCGLSSNQIASFF